LHPNDSRIGEEYKQWKEEMEEKSFMAKSNPLALAGALGDGEIADSMPAQAIESNEQKVSPHF
jgi:THO complex subunit 2 N-terminus